MEREEIRARMAELVSEAKQCISDMSPLLNGLKKADRETEDYQQRVQKAQELQTKAMGLMDEHNALASKLHT